MILTGEVYDGGNPVVDVEIEEIALDIKIGFSDSPRELVISTNAAQADVVAKVTEAIGSDAGVLQLEDEKGAKFIINVSQIAHVEVGTTTARTVGFAGA